METAHFQRAWHSLDLKSLQPHLFYSGFDFHLFTQQIYIEHLLGVRPRAELYRGGGSEGGMQR